MYVINQQTRGRYSDELISCEKSYTHSAEYFIILANCPEIHFKLLLDFIICSLILQFKIHRFVIFNSFSRHKECINSYNALISSSVSFKIMNNAVTDNTPLSSACKRFGM